jgi:hypothetical protein
MTSTTLPQTTRNRQTAEAVDALLVEATNLRISSRFITRRQARKALVGKGTLLARLVAQRKAKAEVR